MHLDMVTTNFPFNICRHIFATLSFIAETFIFLYVGMDALDIEKWKMTITNTRYLLIFGLSIEMPIY